MPPSEHTSIQGLLTLELRDRHGALVERRHVENLITSDGKVLLARLLGGKTSGAVTIAIAVGRSTTAPALDQKALLDKATEAPAEMNDPVIEGERVRANVRATIPQGGDPNVVLPLTEAGILVRVGADQAGVLFNRVTFPVISKSSTMSLLLSWDLTF
jgi:hypothetical protein